MIEAHWKAHPEEHDYPAARAYLDLVLHAALADLAIDELRAAPISTHKAKDILRASRLPLLPAGNEHVRRDLRKIDDGDKLSPVLLIRGRLLAEIPLTIADGYHRVCASHHLDEDAIIPAKLIEL